MAGTSGLERAVGDASRAMAPRRRAVRAVFPLFLASALAVFPACAATHDDAPPAGALSSDIRTFLARFDEYDKVRAVLVARDGVPVFELWRGEHAHDYVNTRSITGTVVSTLIGIAIDEGRLNGPTAVLADLLPAYRAQMSSQVAGTPLTAILSNTAGFAPGGAMLLDNQLDLARSSDWIRAIIADRVARGAGDWRFAYSNAGAHLLAAILTQAVGISVLDYARPRLFEPLGIPTSPAWVVPQRGPPASADQFDQDYADSHFAWPTDPQGIQQGGGLLKLRPEDLLALGMLYANGGSVDGRQVVSKDWVDASVIARTETGRTPPEYGYGWWVDRTDPHRIAWSLGYGGTLIAVEPDQGVTVVVVSDYDSLDPTDYVTQFHTDEAITLVQYAILPRVDDIRN